jgi:hypothetical protein
VGRVGFAPLASQVNVAACVHGTASSIPIEAASQGLMEGPLRTCRLGVLKTEWNRFFIGSKERSHAEGARLLHKDVVDWALRIRLERRPFPPC